MEHDSKIDETPHQLQTNDDPSNQLKRRKVKGEMTGSQFHQGEMHLLPERKLGPINQIQSIATLVRERKVRHNLREGGKPTQGTKLLFILRILPNLATK